MGYTVNKPKKLNTMSRNTDFDEKLKLLEKEIEKRRKQQCYDQFGYQPSTDVCGASICSASEYVNAYDSQGMSCAKVSAAHMPNYSRHDDWSNATIEHLRNENQNLVAKIQKLIADQAILVNYINKLTEENTALKKEKFEVNVHTSLNKVGGGFSNLYQKFITWLNT